MFHQRVRSNLELVLGSARQRLWNTACQIDLRLIGNETGVNHQDLIARIYHGTHRDIKRLGNTGCENHLGLRIIFNTVAVFEVLGEQTAKLRQTAVGGVHRHTLLNRRDSGLGDTPRGIEVRLAHS